MSRKLQFWDTGISGTCLRDLHDPTSFRDTPMGLSILHLAAREWEPGFRRAKPPTAQIERHLRQWPPAGQGLWKGVFRQSWIGVGFCHDPPSLKRKIAQV